MKLKPLLLYILVAVSILVLGTTIFLLALPHNHDFGEWSLAVAPDCLAEGLEVRVCVHDSTHKETRAIAALGHDFTYVVNHDPTCEEDGDAEHVCSRCGTAERPEVLPSIGHKFTAWETTTEPECTTNGKEKRICDHDHDHIEERDIAPKGHSKYWDIVLPATVTTDGQRIKKCHGCTEQFETEIIYATGTEGIEFSLTEDGAGYLVSSYDGQSPEVVVPKFYRPTGSEEYADYKPVVGIGVKAFFRKTSITKIMLHEGITEIADHAFYECKELIEASIPSGVKELGKNAFANCSKLESVTLLEGITKIGDFAFSDCVGIEEIDIPNSVTEIGVSAFSGCNSLAIVTLTKDSQLEIIEKSAFAGCGNIESLELPETIAHIGEMAFMGWGDDQIITLPYTEEDSEENLGTGWQNGMSASILYKVEEE